MLDEEAFLRSLEEGDDHGFGLDHRPSLPELMAASRHRDPNIRHAAIAALLRVQSPDVLPLLLEWLHDSDLRVRRAAIWTAGKMRLEQAIPVLVEALHDPDENVRRSAAWALGELRDPRVVSILRTASQHDPDLYVRRAALSAAEAIENPAARRHKLRPVSARQPPTLARIILSSIALVLIGLLLLAGALQNQPLGSSLQPIGTQVISVEPIVTPQGTPKCGGPPVMLLMLIGVDSHSEDYAGASADIIRIARIDFVAPSVTLLAIPRDLWVEIPGLDKIGVSVNRVKTAYGYGSHYPELGGGANLLAQTLALNFGFQIEHYVAINFMAFAQGIDLSGGVDIYLPKPLTESGVQVFSDGWQHMDGATALRYARIRPDNSSDLERIDRQTRMLMAIREQIGHIDSLETLPTLIQILQTTSQTDLSPAQVSALLCLKRMLKTDDIHSISINPNALLSVMDEFGYERLLADTQAVRGLVRTFQAGESSLWQDSTH
jgi:LCP family protein required for cell wall assembly